MGRFGKNGGSGLRYGAATYRNSGGSNLAQRDDRYRIAQRISDALDATTAPGRVRTLADMTPEEQAEMRRLYERKPGGA